MLWARMLFLGDSLTVGSRDPYGLAWPYYLAQSALRHKIVIQPEIEAVAGRTSGELVRAAWPAIERSKAKESFILIGTNDAKDQVNTPVHQYLRNVDLIVAWLASVSIRPYILTIPVPQGFGSPGYTAEVPRRILAFNKALRMSTLAEQYGGCLIDCANIHETVDGVHLTVEAAMLVADRVWAAVKEHRTLGRTVESVLGEIGGQPDNGRPHWEGVHAGAE